MANVDENISRFMNAKERARKLIQMDANGTLDEVKKNAESSGKLSYSNEGVDTNIMENFTPKDLNQYNNVQPQDFHINKSKLPVEILESFKSKQIDTTLLNGGMTKSNGSVLDQLDMLTNGKVLQQEVKQQPQQVIKETVQVQPQITSTVDYSMIKMIVEDCMRKYTSALKKSILSESKTNENVGTLQAMKIGDKFSFITSNGDLYEAKLTFIKNMNTKKGGN
jgi:hypothetical protein